MKKFLICAAVAAMIMTPAAANAGNRHNDWVGPLIFGTVLGVIIGNANNGHADTVVIERHSRHRNHQRYGHARSTMYYWVEVCGPVTYVRRDHHGNYRNKVFRNECRMVKKASW